MDQLASVTTGNRHTPSSQLPHVPASNPVPLFSPPPPLVKFRTAATRKNERRQTFTKCQLAAATQNLMATQWAVFTDKTAPPTNKGKAKQRIRLILILKNAKILECLIIEKEGSYQLSCFLAFFCCTDAKVSSAGWGAASDTILRRLS